MPRVCVVGSSNIDLTFRTPRLPRPGETLVGRAFHLGFGGKGANQAVMAARLGAAVTMIGRVGRDRFGEQTLGNYQNEGVDTSHLRLDPDHPTGVASITVDDAAQNSIILVPGANQALSAADVEAAAPAIRAADVLLCQLEVPVEAVGAALSLARSAGVRTLLNPAPALPLPDELLRLADLCVPNEIEVEQLTGQLAATQDQAEAAARALLRRGPATVLVTRGERGALLVDAGTSAYFPAVPVAAVDATGAGDVFIGSLAVFLGEGRPLADAVGRAQAVAALSVMHLGTQAAFPSRAEAEAFLAARGLI
jgi:ribokinase